MRRRHDTIGVRLWGPIAALACVVVLCLASPTSAAAPPVQEPPARLENRNTYAMAVACVGVRCAPQTALDLYSVLFPAKHPLFGAWDADTTPLSNAYRRIGIGAATLAINGAGAASLDVAVSQLGILLAGEYVGCWQVRDTDVFYAIPQRYLEVIKDGPMAGRGSLEAGAYAVAYVCAHFVSDKAFAKAVRHDLTHVHLAENPERNRGAVVRVTGNLLRINRYEPPWPALHEGVSDLYEAWIFSETFGSQPYCFFFTDWPEGLSKELLGKEKIDNPPRVTADGYFVKRLTYDAQGPRKEREAPLVIGHTIRPDATPGTTEGPLSWLAGIVTLLLGMLGFVLFTVVGLSWWYRRSDNKLRQRLLAARSPEFIMPPPDAMPIAPVAVPVPSRGAPPRFEIPPGLGGRSGESGPPGKGGDRGSTDDPPEDAGA